MAGENQQERKRLGATYALALYDLAVQQNVLDSVREELKAWAEILKQEPQLIEVFDSVMVSPADREKLLGELGGAMHPVVRSFLSVMNRRRRLGLLPQVIAAFAKEDDRRNNRVNVKLSTAVTIDGHLMEEITATLRKYLKKEPIIEHQIKPNMVGGFIAQAGDLLIDGSIRTRLVMLNKSLLRRGEDEIQSGRDFIGH
jgi:F-type H+-transporting ATPase subunit delta